MIRPTRRHQLRRQFGSHNCALASINSISGLRHVSAETAARTKPFVLPCLPSCLTRSCPQASDPPNRSPPSFRFLPCPQSFYTCSQHQQSTSTLRTCAQLPHIFMRSAPSRFVCITPRSSAYHSPVHRAAGTRYREVIWKQTHAQIAGLEDRRATDLLSLLSQLFSQANSPAMPAEPQVLTTSPSHPSAPSKHLIKAATSQHFRLRVNDQPPTASRPTLKQRNRLSLQ